MSVRVGVVCEGSHDFNVLSKFVDRIIREFGETVEAVDCLQPEVSATFQITGGGWTQVQAWCERQGGQGYRTYLDRPLFATSKAYDILIVHLDGDVVTHCEAPPLTGLVIDGMSVADVVAALQDAILNHWLSLMPGDRARVVPCIPVRHLEAWLSAAIGPSVVDHEGSDMKVPFRSGPARGYRGSWRDRYIAASRIAVTKLDDVRTACASFRLFEADLLKSAEAA